MLRVFGTRSDLLELALAGVRDQIRRRRETAEPGDVEGTVSALFDHYEEYESGTLGTIFARNFGFF